MNTAIGITTAWASTWRSRRPSAWCARVHVLGLTFKEVCPDLRNSKVMDVISELRTYGLEVHVHDPVADRAEALAHYDLALTAWEALPRAEVLVVEARSSA